MTREEELEYHLKEMIELAEEGSSYKGEYLRNKHGDSEYISQAKQVLENRKEM